MKFTKFECYRQWPSIALSGPLIYGVLSDSAAANYPHNYTHKVFFYVRLAVVFDFTAILSSHYCDAWRVREEERAIYCQRCRREPLSFRQS